jgi:hypothetical protein
VGTALVTSAGDADQFHLGRRKTSGAHEFMRWLDRPATATSAAHAGRGGAPGRARRRRNLAAAQPAHAIGLTRGGPEQPACQPLGPPECAEVLGQQQPGDLTDLARISAAEVVRAGNRPHQPTVTLHQPVPGDLIAAAGPRHQVGASRRRCGVLAGVVYLAVGSGGTVKNVLMVGDGGSRSITCLLSDGLAFAVMLGHGASWDQ